MNEYFKDELEILLNEYKEKGSRITSIEIEGLRNKKFIVVFKDNCNYLLHFSHELENKQAIENYLLTTFSNLLAYDILFKKI